MANEQPSEENPTVEVNRAGDHAQAEPIGPLETEGEGTSETAEDSDESASRETTAVQQEEGSRNKDTNQSGVKDTEALAERLAKVEAELAATKSKQPTRARVRIETKTVPPVRKNETIEPPAPTRAQSRRRYLFGKH